MMKQPPRANPRKIRSDLVPFFKGELERHAAGKGAGTSSMTVPDFPQRLLADAWQARASDIHFEPNRQGLRVRLRIDGEIADVMQLDSEQAQMVLNQFKVLAGVDPVARLAPKDASTTFALVDRELDLRLAMAPSSCGETMVVRLLDSKRLERSIRELGLSDENLAKIHEWLEQISGMLLAAGPTGCGKTTTAYALLHQLKSSQRIILSLEDPVEYQIDGITQIQINALQGMNFSEGIRAILRHDPDYLLVGEVRDAASAQTAVSAAISGHVLLSTIHCRDAVGAVSALRNWGLSNREIVDALAVVVAQRLVRVLCEHCRKPGRPTQAERAWLKSLGLSAPPRLWRPIGCNECQQLGYRGRVGVFELWRLNAPDHRLILEGADEFTIRRNLKQRKHPFMLHDVLRKVRDGTTSFEEMKRIGGGLASLLHPRG